MVFIEIIGSVKPIVYFLVQWIQMRTNLIDVVIIKTKYEPLANSFSMANI
jgi:uncharacterized protein YejL (UPF0352 family)